MAGRQPAVSLGKRMEALALTAALLVLTLGIGWLIWSVFEWRHARTPSYRLLGLHIVRRSDERPIRLVRSLARASICCLLVIPTVAVCCVIGLCFAFGASPPDDLLRRPRTAPWDFLTATRVTDERTRPEAHGDFGHAILKPIDLARATRASGTHNEGPAQ
ncbi:MAG: RDD family protein [Acidimicrobiales bacterium]